MKNYHISDLEAARIQCRWLANYLNQLEQVIGRCIDTLNQDERTIENVFNGHEEQIRELKRVLSERDSLRAERDRLVKENKELILMQREII